MKHIILSALCLAATATQAQVAAPMADVNHVVDNTPDSINIARTARPVAGSSRRGNNPVLFLVGNSTMRTGTMGNGSNGQWGWGYYMGDYFDQTRITVENQALGGMSSRTFYNQLWPDVLKGVRRGDWVIIELGHNDNGPYDSGRARASIPGIGTDTLNVVIKETGRHETVRTYGEYMRRYVREVKAKGAYPILFSLTPRCAWDDADSTVVHRVNKTFGLWARQVAEQEGVPFVDLNDISATKFERFGKEKVKTMFYIDRIHTSEFGARNNAESAVAGLRGLAGVALKDYLLPDPVDKQTGRTRRAGRPVVFTIGDSTVKNEDKGEDGMWGWGSVLAEQFDTTKVSVENCAFPGRSARTFLDEGRWDKVYRALQPGDFVIMQFGHNDGGDINKGKARGELHGAGPESRVFRMEATGKNKVVYTYGWYLRKFVMDCREKGATAVILSHTPRNMWKNGVVESNAASFGLWAKQAAEQSGAYFIDLNAISGRKLQELGDTIAANPYFNHDHTHSSKLGARMNAASIAEGLRRCHCPLADALLPLPLTFKAAEAPAYSEMRGYGWEKGFAPDAAGKKPAFFSARLADGNYKVTVRLGAKKRAASTVVRAESRRMMVDEALTKKGRYAEYSFIVNKRGPGINLRDTVRLNKREVGSFTWDDKLTLEFTGTAYAVDSIRIEPAPKQTPTIFLCGNSTVVDQRAEPWCSWGQIFTKYVRPDVAVANHAESGERTSSFLRSKRLDKVLAEAQAGDWVLCEFGHNDEKDRQPGAGAYYNFAMNLKVFIDRARAKGLHIVLLTPTARRRFAANGTSENTHGDYPAATREVARRENVSVIDLTAMTMRLFDALGVEGSKRALVHYPAHTWPGQDKAFADNTHFNPFGATEVARCVVEGIKKSVPELASLLRDVPAFDPAHPDNPDEFVWHNSPLTETEKPLGN